MTQIILTAVIVGFAVFAITKIIDDARFDALKIKHSSELAVNRGQVLDLQKQVVIKDEQLSMLSEQIQELKDKNMLLEDLNSSLIISVSDGGNPKEQLPDKMTNTLRYMDYRKITDKSTHQYWLQQECETGIATGIRLYTDSKDEVYYCAALAKAYGQTIGDAWHVTLQNGEDFNIIFAECKGNDAGYFGHDDGNYDGRKCVNVIEFVVDESKIPFEAADKGTFTALDCFGGLYGNGGNIKSMEYLGRVWEPEGGTV